MPFLAAAHPCEQRTSQGDGEGGGEMLHPGIHVAYLPAQERWHARPPTPRSPTRSSDPRSRSLSQSQPTDPPSSCLKQPRLCQKDSSTRITSSHLRPPTYQPLLRLLAQHPPALVPASRRKTRWGARGSRPWAVNQGRAPASRRRLELRVRLSSGSGGATPWSGLPGAWTGGWFDFAICEIGSPRTAVGSAVHGTDLGRAPGGRRSPAADSTDRALGQYRASRRQIAEVRYVSTGHRVGQADSGSHATQHCPLPQHHMGHETRDGQDNEEGRQGKRGRVQRERGGGVRESDRLLGGSEEDRARADVGFSGRAGLVGA
eukprot:1503672-Rhodomonas_salina.1